MAGQNLGGQLLTFSSWEGRKLHTSPPQLTGNQSPVSKASTQNHASRISKPEISAAISGKGMVLLTFIHPRVLIVAHLVVKLMSTSSNNNETQGSRKRNGIGQSRTSWPVTRPQRKSSAWRRIRDPRALRVRSARSARLPPDPRLPELQRRLLEAHRLQKGRRGLGPSTGSSFRLFGVSEPSLRKRARGFLVGLNNKLRRYPQQHHTLPESSRNAPRPVLLRMPRCNFVKQS